MSEREQQDAIRRRSSALGANLVRARDAAGLTQADLAEKAGTSRATIAQIESGQGDPRLSTLGIIADALGVGPFVLLLGKQDIAKLVALLAQEPKELTPAVPDRDDIALLQELATSHVAADRRRAVRMSSSIASERGFDGVGAAVGAAIGTTLMPGLGTIVGAFLGAVGARKKKASKDKTER